MPGDARLRLTAAVCGLLLAVEAVAIAVLVPHGHGAALPAVVDLPGAHGIAVRVPLAAVSVCIHGDGPHAVAMARHVRGALERAGVAVRPFLAASAPARS